MQNRQNPNNSQASFVASPVLNAHIHNQCKIDTLSKQPLCSAENHVPSGVYKLSPRFSFLVTSGPFVYTAIAVINALVNSSLFRAQIPLISSLQPSLPAPDRQFQVQTVLQFVPQSIDIGFCNFSQRIEKGLTIAFGEVRKHHLDISNFTVQILNISLSRSRAVFRQGPVKIVFAIQEKQGYLNGSEVSELLRNLSVVEFSFYLGFPVQYIAEREYSSQIMMLVFLLSLCLLACHNLIILLFRSLQGELLTLKYFIVK
ncbi:hypothetical protein EYD10_12878 [Varanus komodoensis]|nr:hypothetical protein EYD10_12878 [Varanus komodoensis]